MSAGGLEMVEPLVELVLATAGGKQTSGSAHERARKHAALAVEVRGEKGG